MIQNNQRAAAMFAAAMVMISTNDAIMKLTSVDMSVGQLLFIRGVLACLIFSAAILLSGRSLVPPGGYQRSIIFRAMLETTATLCFVTALTLLPIAVVSTLVWTSPIFIILLAALILGERVAKWRWGAVAAGFAGMLLITRPFEGSFSWLLFLPILAAITVAVRDIVTRKIDHSVDAMHITLPTLVMVTLAGGILSIGRWAEVDWGHVGALAVSASLLSAGFFTQVAAVRSGEVSYIAPFSYAGVLAAVFWGITLWGEVPDLAMIGGICLIVGSGIFIVLRGNN